MLDKFIQLFKHSKGDSPEDPGDPNVPVARNMPGSRVFSIDGLQNSGNNGEDDDDDDDDEFDIFGNRRKDLPPADTGAAEESGQSPSQAAESMDHSRSVANEKEKSPWDPPSEPAKRPSKRHADSMSGAKDSGPKNGRGGYKGSQRGKRNKRKNDIPVQPEINLDLEVHTSDSENSEDDGESSYVVKGTTKYNVEGDRPPEPKSIEGDLWDYYEEEPQKNTTSTASHSESTVRSYMNDVSEPTPKKIRRENTTADNGRKTPSRKEFQKDKSSDGSSNPWGDRYNEIRQPDDPSGSIYDDNDNVGFSGSRFSSRDNERFPAREESRFNRFDDAGSGVHRKSWDKRNKEKRDDWSSGGRTPGGRTPGGRTPGRRTPGGRTPGGRGEQSWERNAGGRTPGWKGEHNWDNSGKRSFGNERESSWDKNPGGRTPGWKGDSSWDKNPGGRTPGWKGDSSWDKNPGGRTPGWKGDSSWDKNPGGRTPGGRTPGGRGEQWDDTRSGRSTPAGRTDQWSDKNSGRRTPGGRGDWNSDKHSGRHTPRGRTEDHSDKHTRQPERSKSRNRSTNGSSSSSVWSGGIHPDRLARVDPEIAREMTKFSNRQDTSSSGSGTGSGSNRGKPAPRSTTEPRETRKSQKSPEIEGLDVSKLAIPEEGDIWSLDYDDSEKKTSNTAEDDLWGTNYNSEAPKNQEVRHEDDNNDQDYGSNEPQDEELLKTAVAAIDDDGDMWSVGYEKDDGATGNEAQEQAQTRGDQEELWSVQHGADIEEKIMMLQGLDAKEQASADRNTEEEDDEEEELRPRTRESKLKARKQVRDMLESSYDDNMDDDYENESDDATYRENAAITVGSEDESEHQSDKEEEGDLWDYVAEKNDLVNSAYSHNDEDEEQDDEAGGRDSRRRKSGNRKKDSGEAETDDHSHLLKTYKRKPARPAAPANNSGSMWGSEAGGSHDGFSDAGKPLEPPAASLRDDKDDDEETGQPAMASVFPQSTEPVPWAVEEYDNSPRVIQMEMKPKAKTQDRPRGGRSADDSIVIDDTEGVSVVGLVSNLHHQSTATRDVRAIRNCEDAIIYIERKLRGKKNDEVLKAVKRLIDQQHFQERKWYSEYEAFKAKLRKKFEDKKRIIQALRLVQQVNGVVKDKNSSSKSTEEKKEIVVLDSDDESSESGKSKGETEKNDPSSEEKEPDNAAQLQNIEEEEERREREKMQDEIARYVYKLYHMSVKLANQMHCRLGKLGIPLFCNSSVKPEDKEKLLEERRKLLDYLQTEATNLSQRDVIEL